MKRLFALEPLHVGEIREIRISDDLGAILNPEYITLNRHGETVKPATPATLEGQIMSAAFEATETGIFTVRFSYEIGAELFIADVTVEVTA
jgi:hypothetical protein